MTDDDIELEGAKPSVGIVAPQTLVFPELKLICGETLRDVGVCYEMYGTLSPEKDNAVLVLHALSGSAHAAGYHDAADRKPGWWENMIGPGKAFDTDRYCVIAPNALGSCYGSTGPASVNPETGVAYAGHFPVITIEDMVHAVALLADALGIRSWLAVAGGSMGGMMALQWDVSYPGRTRSVIAIATGSQSSAQGIAFSYVGRQAIMRDPKWRNGFYPPDDPPSDGLAVARMIGHITYVSELSLDRKFGRRLQDREAFSYSWHDNDFCVESYLNYQGQQFVKRFDPNAYLTISRAIEYFNLADQSPDKTLSGTLKRSVAPALVISFSTDWIYPPPCSQMIHESMLAAGRDSAWYNLESPLGHDAFLIETAALTALISSFLEKQYANCR